MLRELPSQRRGSYPANPTHILNWKLQEHQLRLCERDGQKQPLHYYRSHIFEGCSHVAHARLHGYILSFNSNSFSRPQLSTDVMIANISEEKRMR